VSGFRRVNGNAGFVSVLIRWAITFLVERLVDAAVARSRRNLRDRMNSVFFDSSRLHLIAVNCYMPQIACCICVTHRPN